VEDIIKEVDWDNMEDSENEAGENGAGENEAGTD